MAYEDDLSDLPAWKRYMILMGSGMTSSKRGIQQVMHDTGLKYPALGSDDASMQGIADEQAATKRLSDATPGGFLAEMAGNAADPVNLIPMGKAALTARSLGRLAATGALTSGLGEVKEGGSRLGNMAMGAAMTAGVPAAQQGASKIWAGKKANLPEGSRIEHGYTLDNTQSPERVWIDQSRTRIRPEAIAKTDEIHATGLPGTATGFQGTLGKILDAPDVYAAYPGIEKTPINIKLHEKAQGGGFNPDTGAISIESSSLGHPQAFADMIHELQHKVQHIEGNPGGDNPDRIADLIGNRGYHAYLANPGEIEARDAAARTIIDPANKAGHDIYSLHSKGPNQMAMKTAKGLPGLPDDSVGILRDKDPTGILSSAMTTPELFHKMPLDTLSIHPENMLDTVAQGAKIDDLIRALRFQKDRTWYGQ